jgi:hypothetical protein
MKTSSYTTINFVSSATQNTYILWYSKQNTVLFDDKEGKCEGGVMFNTQTLHEIIKPLKNPLMGEWSYNGDLQFQLPNSVVI